LKQLAHRVEVPMAGIVDAAIRQTERAIECDRVASELLRDPRALSDRPFSAKR
jgi:hypothetical protein